MISLALAILSFLPYVTDAHAFARHAVAPPNPEASIVAGPLPGPGATPGLVKFYPVPYYATTAEQAKAATAGIKLNQVVQSKCFHDFIASRALIQTNGRTPAQVADHLQSLRGMIPVKFYYRMFTSAVAYRQPPSLEINLNRKFYGPKSTDCEVASVEGHESLGHALGGYDHAFNWNPQRDYSVPYSINKAFDVCCK